MEGLDVEKKLVMIQYHQGLIISMLEKSDAEFYKLIIKNGLAEEDVRKFYDLCENLSNELEEQKAEGFVYYHPLYQKFSDSLPKYLSAKEVVRACIAQNLYLSLMNELQNYS